MKIIKAICPWCNQEFNTTLGILNAAKKRNGQLFCCRDHAFQIRKTSIEDKKAKKAAYDKQLRAQPWYKEYKNSNWKKNYDPVKAAEYRKKRMAYHVQYCQSPQYREWKKEYDAKRQDKLAFGEFSECAPLLEQIFTLIDNRVIKQHNQLINKSTKRKRSWLRTKKTSLPQ